MFCNAEICNMMNYKPQNTSKISGIFILILTGLITASSLILKYFNVINVSLEIVIAPFLVIALLTYGDKILIYGLLNPINRIVKLRYNEDGHQEVSNH